MRTTEELQLARVQEESEARPKRKKAIPLYLEDYVALYKESMQLAA